MGRECVLVIKYPFACLIYMYILCATVFKSATKINLPLVFNPQTAGVIGWISDSYCSIKPLCLGMGEVVPAHTSPTLLPPSPRTVL